MEQGVEEDVQSIVPDIDNIQEWVNNLGNKEGLLESPININISLTKPVEAPKLSWINFEVKPRKMKLSNSGHTIILSAKWYDERPYIKGGPLLDKYVFSQMHIHWGAHDMEGSEHTTDNMRHPAEIHVVTFKSCYLTQEAALKENDGVVIIVYILRLSGAMSRPFQLILNSLVDIKNANTSVKITPFPLNILIKPFEADFFCYWGSILTEECIHFVFWLICRDPIGVTTHQIDNLRVLFDAEEKFLLRNFRPIKPLSNRHILHVNPSGSKYATLKPLPREPKKRHEEY